MRTLADLTEIERASFRDRCQHDWVHNFTRDEQRNMLSAATGLRSVLPSDHPLLAVPLLPNRLWNHTLMAFLIGECRGRR